MPVEPDQPHPHATVGYRDAGVDIDAGNALVAAIKPLVKATRRPGADADLGGFGGLFDLKAAGFRDPILVAANDGVGTKLKIAITSPAPRSRVSAPGPEMASALAWFLLPRSRDNQ